MVFDGTRRKKKQNKNRPSHRLNVRAYTHVRVRVRYVELAHWYRGEGAARREGAARSQARRAARGAGGWGGGLLAAPGARRARRRVIQKK